MINHERNDDLSVTVTTDDSDGELIAVQDRLDAEMPGSDTYFEWEGTSASELAQGVEFTFAHEDDADHFVDLLDAL